MHNEYKKLGIISVLAFILPIVLFLTLSVEYANSAILNAKETAGFSYSWNNKLQLGMKNNSDVAALQQAFSLEKLYTGDIDGSFGRKTLTSVKKFQRKYNLKPDGVVGSKTRGILNKLYSSKRSTHQSETVPTPTSSSPLKIIFPNGNERLNLMANYTITWISTDPNISTVQISLFKNNEYFYTIAENLPNTGRFSWAPDNLGEVIFKIQIIGFTKNKTFITNAVDLSDNTFSIIPPTTISTITSSSWVIVFTHHGVPLSQKALDRVCSEERLKVFSWIDREANKYGKARPFDTIVCLKDQVLLPRDLSPEFPVISETGIVTNPFNYENNKKVTEFLEAQIPAIKIAKYVSLYHYTPYFKVVGHPFVGEMGGKYDFQYAVESGPSPTDMPTITGMAQELIHEFMHKIMATDKYWTGLERACQIDPRTGQEYNGYDIMCHRVPTIGSMSASYGEPRISELLITDPTAEEIKWK